MVSEILCGGVVPYCLRRGHSGFWSSGRIFLLDLVASYTGVFTLGKPTRFALLIDLFTSLYITLTEKVYLRKYFLVCA